MLDREKKKRISWKLRLDDYVESPFSSFRDSSIDVIVQSRALTRSLPADIRISSEANFTLFSLEGKLAENIRDIESIKIILNFEPE